MKATWFPHLDSWGESGVIARGETPQPHPHDIKAEERRRAMAEATADVYRAAYAATRRDHAAEIARLEAAGVRVQVGLGKIQICGLEKHSIYPWSAAAAAESAALAGPALREFALRWADRDGWGEKSKDRAEARRQREAATAAAEASIEAGMAAARRAIYWAQDEVARLRAAGISAHEHESDGTKVIITTVRGSVERAIDWTPELEAATSSLQGEDLRRAVAAEYQRQHGGFPY